MKPTIDYIALHDAICAAERSLLSQRAPWCGILNSDLATLLQAARGVMARHECDLAVHVTPADYHAVSNALADSLEVRSPEAPAQQAHRVMESVLDSIFPRWSPR